MISFSVTPFTDLPAHRIIRSYFTKERRNEEQTAVDSELSHLWSEERRYEEKRFAMIMAELDAVSKELGIVVSGTPDLESTAAAETGSSIRRNEISTTPEADLPLADRLIVAPSEASAYMDLDTWYLLEKAREEQRQERWLNSMNIKVQTLLQEAHHVLGTSMAPSSTSESLQGLGSDIANENESSYSVPFDVISLYMRDESSFTSEGSTLLEGNTSFDRDSIIPGSNSDGDWLVGDTSTDTADTSFSSDQYVATDKPDQSQECIYVPMKQLDPVLERPAIQCHSSIQWSPFTNDVLLP